MNKIAVFDCDDVLANLRDPLQDLVSEHLKTPVYWKDWNQYEIGKVYGFDFSHICEMIVKRNTLFNLQPEPYARALIRSYKQEGCRTVVLTARGYHPHGKQITTTWLNMHGLEIDDVICIGLKEHKRDYLDSMTQVEVYVEDNHHHAEQAHDLPNVKRIFLLDRPWNQNETRVTRVPGLKDIFDLKTNKTI